MNQYDFHPDSQPPRSFGLGALLVLLAIIALITFTIL